MLAALLPVLAPIVGQAAKSLFPDPADRHKADELRSRLQLALMENAVHLGAQLPMLLRGAYYEGWHPVGTPTRERHLADFIDHVGAQLPRETTINPGEAARACFAVMERCLDRGELVKLRGSLPHEVLNLFPDSLVRR